MPVSKVAQNLIKQYEGIVIKNGLVIPYHGKADAPGVMTIGWGHKIPSGQLSKYAKGITLVQAETLFQSDVVSHTKNISKDVKVALSQNQFDALASFAFNLGPTILTTGNGGKQTTLLKKLNQGGYEEAALQIHLFCNSNNKFEEGLFFRRLTETLLYLTGEIIRVNYQNVADVIHKIGKVCTKPTVEADLRTFYKTKSKKALPKIQLESMALESVSIAPAVKITFGPRAKKEVVSTKSIQILKAVASAAGVSELFITSTQRSAEDQARAMFDNLQSEGVAKQKLLYGSMGDKVIDRYVLLKKQGKTAAQIKLGMTSYIKELGPGKVSKHCADPKKLNVVDIAPGSIGNRRQKFMQAVAKEKRISKLLVPPNDPAFHVEIPQ